MPVTDSKNYKNSLMVFCAQNQLNIMDIGPAAPGSSKDHKVTVQMDLAPADYATRI
jgi:hypothetical protein